MTQRQALLLVFVSCGVAACAPHRPVLYPNERLRQVGNAAAQREVDQCMQLADQYLSSGTKISSNAGAVATDTAVGGATGAAVGAVGGAVVGNAGTGAAVGAATGATAGLMGSLFGTARNRQPDPTYANFVTRCLHERGYDTIGWE